MHYESVKLLFYCEQDPEIMEIRNRRKVFINLKPTSVPMVKSFVKLSYLKQRNKVCEDLVYNRYVFGSIIPFPFCLRPVTIYKFY